MRHLGLFLMGSLALAACASHNTPPAASSSTVAQATNEPNRGPDFAPAASDGLATASVTPGVAPATRSSYSNDNTANNTTASGSQSSGSASATTGTNSTSPQTREFATGAREPAVDTTTGNAAATPADRSSAPHTDADNSRVNKRDRNGATLTPMDQGSSASDRAITQQIRKDLMNDKTLSFTAKNVKVITIDGKVTLRGTVKSEAERSAIEAAARRATGDGGRVDSQLEIAK